MTPPAGSSTRERLLAAAEALFADRGFDDTSVRELAAHAGCNLSLIHYYFGSKEGLLTELVRSKTGQAGSALEAAASASPDAATTVRAFVAFLVDFATENQAFLRMVFREVLGTSRPAFTEVRGRIQQNLRILDALFAGGQEAGHLRPLDRPVAAVALAGMTLFYFVALPLTSEVLGPPTPELRERLRSTLTEVFLNGVLAGPPPQGGER